MSLPFDREHLEIVRWVLLIIAQQNLHDSEFTKTKTTHQKIRKNEKMVQK